MQTDCFPDSAADWAKAPVQMLADVNPRYPVKKGLMGRKSWYLPAGCEKRIRLLPHSFVPGHNAGGQLLLGPGSWFLSCAMSD